MRYFITLAATAMMAFATSAKAGVAINETNFPDPYLRDYVSYQDWDENGILEGDEFYCFEQVSIDNVTNLKGLELLPVTLLYIGYNGDPEDERAYAIKSADFGTLCPNLVELIISTARGLESLDLSRNSKLVNVDLRNCPALKDVKWASSIESLSLQDLQQISDINGSDFPNLISLLASSQYVQSSIENIDFTGHQKINRIEIWGSEENRQNINTFHVENCPNLSIVVDSRTTVQSFTIKNLPIFKSLHLTETTTENVDIQDCPELEGVICEENELVTLQLSNNPKLWQVQCNDNRIRNFFADNCPSLYWVHAFNNQFMWLDMTDVVYCSNITSEFRVDNQTPAVQAVKISPTEVGLRVHDRLDVSRVLNLKAKGQAMEPKEIFVDGIRYFVIYNNGPEVESLVGAAGTTYEYQTKWPYPFHAAEGDYEGDSKDDNLPVTLNVTSWTKHPAWIKLATSGTVRGEYGQPAPQGPQEKDVLRSQDYDGKLTWKSGNENVVKVNAETGELTVVGAGSAIITISGAETDYRLAPSVIRYTVVIDKATPTFAFEKSKVDASDGVVPENKLDVGLYDGTVVYTSSDEEIATVDAEGKVTVKQDGNVTITATGAETGNCYEAVSAQYVMNITGTSSVTGITVNTSSDEIYNVAGQRIQSGINGIQIINGRKILKQ